VKKVWPIACIDGRKPVRSQEYKPRVHLGLDVMFTRLPSDPPYAAADPRGTKGFHVPPAALCVAAHDGYVLYAKLAANGFRVRLASSQAWPLQTLYLHLLDLQVQPGQLVTAGQPLGLVGGDPTEADPRHTIHLHFETRDYDEPFDPEHWLEDAEYV
jgi:hypothetical protein